MLALATINIYFFSISVISFIVIVEYSLPLPPRPWSCATSFPALLALLYCHHNRRQTLPSSPTSCQRILLITRSSPYLGALLVSGRDHVITGLFVLNALGDIYGLLRFTRQREIC